MSKLSSFVNKSLQIGMIGIFTAGKKYIRLLIYEERVICFAFQLNQPTDNIMGYSCYTYIGKTDISISRYIFSSDQGIIYQIILMAILLQETMGM